MRVSARPAAVAVWVFVFLVALLASAPCALAKKGDEALSFDTEDFSLKLGLFLQTGFWYLDGKYTYSGSYFPGFENTEIDPRGDFFVRNARVALSGRAFLPNLTYVFELDAGQKAALPGEAGLSRDPRVTDAYLNLHLSDLANVRVGQFKPPFDLFHLMSTRYEMFPEQPAGTNRLNPGRDLGVMYSGSTLEQQLNWYLAVTNGAGANQPRNDNSDMAYAARLEWQSKGGFKYRASAIDHPDHLEYTAGLAYLDNQRNPGVNTALDETGDNCLPGASLACTYPSRGETGLEAFGALRGRRFQVNATYQKWTFEDAALSDQDPALAAPQDLDLTYYNVDAGFFVTDAFEVLGRYGSWKHDDTGYFWNGNEWTDTRQALDPLNITFVGATDVKLDEARVGAAWYPAGANLKLVLDYGWTKQTVQKNDTLEPNPLGAGTATFKVSGFRLLLSFFI